MKRGTIDHPKMRALLKALPVTGRYAAVGILESLWHFAALYAWQGDIGRHDDAAIAEWIGWQGSPESLIEPLVTTGWLDRVDGPERLVVHDWQEHCDDSVKKRMQRELGRVERHGNQAETCPGSVESGLDMSGHVNPRARGSGLGSGHGNEEGGEGETPPVPDAFASLTDRDAILRWFHTVQKADPSPAYLAAWRGAIADLASRHADAAAIAAALKWYSHAEGKYRGAMPTARFLNADWFLGLVAKCAEAGRRDVMEE